jgi:hypothetical protein
MKTKKFATKKAEARQQLINSVNPSAINFELIKVGQTYGIERVISVNVGHSFTGITLNSINGARKIKAKSQVIDNQPCVFIEL